MVYKMAVKEFVSNCNTSLNLRIIEKQGLWSSAMLTSDWDFINYYHLPFTLFPYPLKEIIVPTIQHYCKLESKEDNVGIVHSPVLGLGWDSTSDKHYC